MGGRDARAPGLWGFVAAAGAGGRGAGPVIRVRGGEVYLGERLSAVWGWRQGPPDALGAGTEVGVGRRGSRAGGLVAKRGGEEVDGDGSLVLGGGEDRWGGRGRIPCWQGREDGRGSRGQAPLWGR